MSDTPATPDSPRSQAEDLAARLRSAEERLARVRKLEVLGRLTGAIAHEFNNLLTGILGYASLLKTLVPEGGGGHEAAGYIEQSARRASELTRQLLAYSRREPADLLPVALHEVVGQAIGILSRSVGGNVRIRTDLGASPDRVMGDPGDLLQALVHLGGNAADAMPRGGVLTLATDPFASDGAARFAGTAVPEGAYVRVSVSDTGAGIPEAIREKIFSPFFTTKPPGERAGVGLSIVRSCIRSHGGLLHVESREGEGTTFRFLLRAARDPA